MIRQELFICLCISNSFLVLLSAKTAGSITSELEMELGPDPGPDPGPCDGVSIPLYTSSGVINDGSTEHSSVQRIIYKREKGRK